MKTDSLKRYLRVCLVVCLILAAIPAPVPAQAAEPAAVDAMIDKLMQVDPAAISAALKQHNEQAAAWEAEAAALREQATAIQQQADAITARLDSLKDRVTALSALFTEAATMNAEAPADAMASAPAMAGDAPAMAGGEMMGGEMEVAAAEAAAPAVTYRDHILPMLQAQCGNCHNQDKARGGLQVDDFGALMEGGSSGSVLALGNADGSRLFRLVNGSESPVMPPEGQGTKLTAEQLELLRTWINLGAPENSGSKIMVAEETKVESAPAYIAAAIVDGPPPMPEVAMALPVDVPPLIPARAIASNPRSALLAVAGHEQVSLYNLETNALIGVLPFPEGEIYALTFSVSGELLVAAGGRVGEYGCAVVWNVRKAERAGVYAEGYDTILAADISPDHKLIAVGGPNKRVDAYSTETGERLYELTTHTDWIYAVKFTPDGEVLASADRAGGLFLWQAANGRAVEQLRGHADAIHGLTYTADSAILASAGADGTVRLWNTWDYTAIRQFNAHGGGTLSVDFSPTSEIVTTGIDRQLKRWDINGTELLNYGGLPDWGYQARFGLAGGKVVAGTWNGEVAVWNMDAAERVATLTTSISPEQVKTQLAAAQ